VEALRFLAGHCARRERPLRAGMFISTGAATGIHDIEAGQRARVDFGALGAIECVAVAAKPQGIPRAARA
jgi:2-keto-4-pentenoate hydratase